MKNHRSDFIEKFSFSKHFSYKQLKYLYSTFFILFKYCWLVNIFCFEIHQKNLITTISSMSSKTIALVSIISILIFLEIHINGVKSTNSNKSCPNGLFKCIVLNKYNHLFNNFNNEESKPEFICIDMIRVCDGKPDCPNKEDEVNCKYHNDQSRGLSFY